MGRKFKICDVCKRRFHREQENRLQIIKRLKKGKVEFWVCNKCSPAVAKALREQFNIQIYIPEKDEEEDKDKENAGMTSDKKEEESS